MKLFRTEGDARQYLDTRVPPKEKDKVVDLLRLQEQLFDVPEVEVAGHHEFEGKHGLKISFDLVEAEHAFNDCWLIYGKLFDDGSGNGLVTGEMRPIFVIQNLKLQTEHFSYDSQEHARSIHITWLPRLRGVGTDLSPSFVHVDRGDVYLAGKEGWFSRPQDLLGFFHEVGHVETRSLTELSNERASVKTTISSKGVQTEPNKLAALEIQRERDANAWMLQKVRKLFDDLNIPRELLRDYVHHAQLQSYHEKARRRIARDTEGKSKG